MAADAASVVELEELAAEWVVVAREAVDGLREEGATYKTATGFSRPTAHVANLKEATSQLRQLALAIARLKGASGSTGDPTSVADAAIAQFNGSLVEWGEANGCPPKYRPPAGMSDELDDDSDDPVWTPSVVGS